MSKLLTVKDLHKSYHDGQRELKVLRGVNLEVEPSEAIAIVGMSGAGKSTLMHLLGGLDQPDKGSLAFDGEEISKLSRARMDQFRNRRIGFVFQFHHLLPEFTARENVMMPALVARKSKAEARKRADDLLAEVGLTERTGHRPAKLSGGEQQRVALARALMNQPSLVLADEPTGNLDLKTGRSVIETLWQSTVKQNRALIIVSHELTIAQRADRIFILRDGRLQSVDRAGLKERLLED